MASKSKQKTLQEKQKAQQNKTTNKDEIQNPEGIVKQELENQEKKATVGPISIETFLDEQYRIASEKADKKASKSTEVSNLNPEEERKRKLQMEEMIKTAERDAEIANRNFKQGLIEMNLVGDSSPFFEEKKNPYAVLNEYQSFQDWDSKTAKRQESKQEYFEGRRRREFLKAEGNANRRWNRYVNSEVPLMLFGLMKKAKK